MKKITFLFAAVALNLCAVAQNFTALYPFDSVKTTSGTTDPTPVPVASGVTFNSFMATGTPANPNATGRFSFTDWAIGATASSDVYATHTGIVNTGEYYEVTVTPVATYTLTLTSITFKVQRSGTGIRTYAVRSSADTYLTNLPASINPANTNLSVQPGDIFYWNLDAVTSGQDGSTITLSGPSFTNITSPVTFRFYGWNAEGSGGTFSIDNVTINGSVTAPMALTADFTATNVCYGDSTTFTNLSTGPNPIVSTIWNFGDGSALNTSANPKYHYNAAGTFGVTLVVVDNMANTDTITDSVIVYPKPLAGFTAPSSVCGGTVQFLDGSTIISGTITAWEWNFGDPASGTNDTSTIQDPSHIFSAQGNYTVQEIVTSDMGCKDTTAVMISNYILNVSLTGVAAADSVTFSEIVSGGTAPYSYMLDFGDGSVSSSASVVHHYLDGTYTACLIVVDMNGCMDSSCVTITILTTGINENSRTFAEFKPNPSADGIFMLNTGNLSKGTLTVYNILGEIIVTEEISEGKNIIDLSAEANGSYYVNIKTDKEMITKKIIVNK
jgi:PKD repeat protein